MANDRKFDVDYDSFFVFQNRLILMGDIPCFHCRFKYFQDSIKYKEIDLKIHFLIVFGMVLNLTLQ